MYRCGFSLLWDQSDPGFPKLKFEEKVDMQELIYAKSSPPESLAEHTERCLAMLEQLKQHY